MGRRLRRKGKEELFLHSVGASLLPCLNPISEQHLGGFAVNEELSFTDSPTHSSEGRTDRREDEVEGGSREAPTLFESVILFFLQPDTRFSSFYSPFRFPKKGGLYSPFIPRGSTASSELILLALQ